MVRSWDVARDLPPLDARHGFRDEQERDRWHLVPEAGDRPAAIVRMDADTAWRLLSRTMTVAAALPTITTEGDETLARAATRAVAIMTTTSL